MAVTIEHLKQALPDGVFDRLVKSLSAVSTVSAYVFGSYARGEQAQDSDVDLYVVTRDNDGRRAIENAMLVGDELICMPIPVDVLSSHASEFAHRSQGVNAVEARVAREGVLISG